MDVIGSVDEFQERCLHLRCSGSTTALVPTMGFFHEGHLSLMRWARENADVVVVSLFVNPTQFGPAEDLDRYPRDMDRDQALARAEGVDVLFTPAAEEVYSPHHATWVEVPELSRPLCGQSRPHFFRGVCTVVCKLLHLAWPHMAVFGQKDWQQMVVVRRMVKDLNMPVDIVGRPIVREEDGLAMSSRNAYLSEAERREAAHIYAGLQQVQAWVQAGEQDPETLKTWLGSEFVRNIPSGRVDYIHIVDPWRLSPVRQVDREVLVAVAVHIGSARLIDNIRVEG